MSTSTVWYQYGFLKPQAPIEKNSEEYFYIKTNIKLLRDNLIKTFELDDNCSTRFTTLILRRENRRILNVQEFSKYLKNMFHIPLKVLIVDSDTIVNFSKLKFLLQNIICTKTLISMHGSEQILSIFIQPSNDVRIIEIFPFGIDSNQFTVYRILVKNILNYSYYSWTNPLKHNTVFPNNNYPRKYGGLSHLTEQQQQSIRESIDQPLKPFLCCDNPHWLYRIYQDTVIDINLFNDAFISQQTSTTLNNRDNKFQLSEIENLHCTRIIEDGKTKLNITWTRPWNLPLALNSSLLNVINDYYHYEIAVQAFDSKLASIYQTKQEWLTINNEQNTCHHIWVKLNINNHYLNDDDKIIINSNITSTFNRTPLFCCFHNLKQR